MKLHINRHRLAHIAVASAVTCAILLTFTIGGCSHFHGSHADEHASHASPAGASALVLNDGKKWETDQPLRTGMLRIRAWVEPLRFSANTQSLDPAQAKAVATGVQEQVSYLIDNCKLEPKADAALHVLIGDMLKGSSELRSDTPSGSGLVLIRQALQQYPQYFDHPGWPDAAGGKP